MQRAFISMDDADSIEFLGGLCGMAGLGFDYAEADEMASVAAHELVAGCMRAQNIVQASEM